MIKISIIGTRGIPARYGGFETFAQEVSMRLVKLGFDVVVYCDRGHIDHNEYNGVSLKFALCTKSENPLRYYLSTLHDALNSHSDVILSCGGVGFFLPLKWFYRKSIIITNTDGVEYKRDKWNLAKKLFIFLSERLNVRLSNYLIADSTGILNYLQQKYHCGHKTFKIEYGAYIVNSLNEQYLRELHVLPNNYYLVVSRLEPENNVLTIIEGYLRSGVSKPLIVVGNLNDTPFVKQIRAFESERVKFVGGVYDKSKLESLRVGAFAYLHGHSVGGTNPSLLEALGCGNVVIAHDNIYNREVTNNAMYYFKDNDSCADAIKTVDSLSSSQIQELKRIAVNRIKDYYNWDRITSEYAKVFDSVIE